MSEYSEWLVKHEKLVAAITFALVIALVVQMKFCKAREPEANLPERATALWKEFEAEEKSNV